MSNLASALLTTLVVALLLLAGIYAPVYLGRERYGPPPGRRPSVPLAPIEERAHPAWRIYGELNALTPRGVMQTA